MEAVLIEMTKEDFENVNPEILTIDIYLDFSMLLHMNYII